MAASVVRAFAVPFVLLYTGRGPVVALVVLIPAPRRRVRCEAEHRSCHMNRQHKIDEEV